MDDVTSIRPDQLPTVVQEFLAAHEAHDPDTALRTFTPDAVVVDDGTTYRGTAEVERFVTKAGAEFTYTATLVDAARVDATHWVVARRLEGDFPGGVALLHYRFTTTADHIAQLQIAP